jgi:hypothetical protein
MSEVVTKQVCIFAPTKQPYDGSSWAETIFGRIIKPLVASHAELRWFWFLRYGEPKNSGSPDFDVSRIADDFFPGGNGRLVRFRISIQESDFAAFESDGSDLIQQEGCGFSHWPDYGGLGELGGARFCGENGIVKPSAERAELNAQMLCSLSKLVLHSLVGPDADGRYKMESNVHKENPNGSTFESLHHCFCNMTGVPLDVIVLRNKQTGVQVIGTQWNLHVPNPTEWEMTAKIPVSY